MEFNAKLQELRKQKGFTQEELAGLLFVSRTAISKWESGRGFPNIESLKALSKVFQIPVDMLISGDELLTAADQEAKEKTGALAGMVFGILDCMALLLFFLPLFGQEEAGHVRAVALLSLGDIDQGIKMVYLLLMGLSVLWGLAGLILQAARPRKVDQRFLIVSLLITLAIMTALIMGRHPYAAVLTLFLLITKGVLLLKSR